MGVLNRDKRTAATEVATRMAETAQAWLEALEPDQRAMATRPAPGTGTEAETERAITEPPPGTRAWFRGKCLARWPDAVVTANWDSLVFDVGTDPLRRVPMMDPLKGTAEHTGALLAESTSPADLLERLNS